MPPSGSTSGRESSSHEMAARKGLGVLGFSVGDRHDMEPILRAYKIGVKDADFVDG